MAQSAPAAAVSNIYNTPELRDKIMFTLLCLIIYRVGAHITAPGIDVVALTDFFENQGKGGLLGLYDLFVGGGLSHATVFALGIMPYISASIFMQIAGVVIPTVEKMQKDEEGRKRVTQWTRYFTVVLAIVQAWGFALFTSSLENAVLNPGFGFRLQMVLVLTTGAIFVMWLGEQITERGLGNGASLIIFFSIVERFWPGIFSTVGFVRTQVVGPFSLIVLGLVMLGVVAGTVAITMAARRVMIQIPQRTMARGRQREAAKNFIPLRVNAAGVMLYYALSAVLIVFFTYFYTSIIFNPVDISENLKKQGGFIPGVKPGARTAEYIDHVVSRITFPGSIFLTFIALLPVFIADAIAVPFAFGGTSLLIVVGVALDTMAQVNQHLLLRKYDGFMKKGRVRFRGRTTGGTF
jgi:preprotein translocase subunit SecY